MRRWGASATGATAMLLVVLGACVDDDDPTPDRGLADASTSVPTRDLASITIESDNGDVFLLTIGQLRPETLALEAGYSELIATADVMVENLTPSESSSPDTLGVEFYWDPATLVGMTPGTAPTGQPLMAGSSGDTAGPCGDLIMRGPDAGPAEGMCFMRVFVDIERVIPEGGQIETTLVERVGTFDWVVRNEELDAAKAALAKPALARAQAGVGGGRTPIWSDFVETSP